MRLVKEPSSTLCNKTMLSIENRFFSMRKAMVELKPEKTIEFVQLKKSSLSIKRTVNRRKAKRSLEAVKRENDITKRFLFWKGWTKLSATLMEIFPYQNFNEQWNQLINKYSLEGLAIYLLDLIIFPLTHLDGLTYLRLFRRQCWMSKLRRGKRNERWISARIKVHRALYLWSSVFEDDDLGIKQWKLKSHAKARYDSCKHFMEKTSQRATQKASMFTITSFLLSSPKQQVLTWTLVNNLITHSPLPCRLLCSHCPLIFVDPFWLFAICWRVKVTSL